MHRFLKLATVIFLAVCLVSFPLGVAAEMDTAMGEKKEADTGKMAADLLLIRPMGIVSTVLGCSIYVVSLPFSIPGGNQKEVWHTAVVEPAKFTFKRGIGDF